MIQVNDIIKINPDLCPEDKRNSCEYRFGTLDYKASFLKERYKILEIFFDKFRGQMVRCEVLEKNETICLVLSDCLRA